MRHHGRLVVEGDVVVGILPARRRRRRAAARVDVRVVLERTHEPCAHRRLIDQQLALVVHELHAVGVHEGQERIERVAGIHAHRLADGEAARTRRAPEARLHLVAPEGPVLGPVLRNIAFLEAGLLEQVLPILDMHRLLLEREGVVGARLGDVVPQQRGFERVGREGGRHRAQNAREILKPAFEGPFAGDLEVVNVGIGHVRHGLGIQRRDGLRDHVLDRVLRQLDLDARAGFEFANGFEQRVVFGFVKAFDPPDFEFFLRRGGHGGSHESSQYGKSDTALHLRSSPEISRHPRIFRWLVRENVRIIPCVSGPVDRCASPLPSVSKMA